MRSFIAIELPADLRARLSALAHAGLVSGAGLRWVAEPSLHLTLKFLGEVDARRVPELAQALRDAASRCPPFALTARGLGFFPSSRAPRVFWVGIESNRTLLDLVAAIEQRFAPLGFAVESRPFKSHITLARIEGRVQIAADRVSDGQPIFATWSVPRIVLMESQPARGGSRYGVVAEAPLAAPLTT